MEKIRLDKFLVENKNIKSRYRAALLVKNEMVFVNGKLIKKPSVQIKKDDVVEVIGKDIQWVSRGGLKLEKALKFWKINPKDWICLDIGASTGGFTDVLIAKKAKMVYAVDVGHDQLDEKLRNNPRVVNLEKVDARKLDNDKIRESVDFISVDVSYISLSLILPEIIKFLKPNGKIVALIKPQFELSPDIVKKGIIRKKEHQELAVKKIRKLVKGLNLAEEGIIESPILGKKGNKEFLIYLQKN